MPLLCRSGSTTPATPLEDGANGDTRKNIAEPLGNKVFFAGEATNDNGHHATVHGAVETAYREVINVLNSI